MMTTHKILKQGLVLILVIFILSSCNPSSKTDPAGQVPSETVEVNPTSEPSLSPSPSDTSTPLPDPIFPSVEITGVEEIVYDWTTDRCADDMLPDLPVRVFRDDKGMIQFNLSFTTNYRLTGPDLDSLKPDCTPTLVSNFDKDPSHFSYSEWLGSTYTLDGKTIYAFIHNEFYGSDTSHWYAQRDFSSEQGSNDWQYQGWNGTSYNDMVFDAGNNRWQGNQALCQVGNTWVHPDLFCEPTRTWISPVNDTITISGSTGLYNPAGSNGVIVRIFKNDLEIWSVTMDAGDGNEHFFEQEVTVQEGDVVRFRVDARGDTNFDSTYLNPKINIGPDPCPSQLRQDCSNYAVTYAISTDGGRSYTRQPSPDNLIATLPYRYEPDWGFIGMWQPSNIVFNPKDGYYYFLIQHEFGTIKESDRLQGSCVLRSETLDDPTSWRAWDGDGFNMRMINPYTEPDADPLAHTCQIVSRKNLGYAALNYNLTYNSFFEKFLLVGHQVNVSVPGFYYSLSDDLVHWSPIELLMEADLAQTVDWEGPYLAYPALIDPDDTSMNFEVTGQRPYLYFTRINGLSPKLDFDLVRIRIQFDK